MCETQEISSPIGQLVRPAALEPRDCQFESRFGQSLAEIVKNEKTKRNQECCAELMFELSGLSFASQKCTGRDKTELIECKASTMIPSKSTPADNGDKVSQDSSNTEAAVCEHEQSPCDDEETELECTKEALTFKWYEEPEDWDRLCPADDDADMDDMKTRHRELYLSILRLDMLKKMTTTKNNDRISSEQKKEIQDEARRVGLLVKEYDSLWTEQGCSSAGKSSGLSR
jgi:hypothetical protein